jgi:hypothetical protein
MGVSNVNKVNYPYSSSADQFNRSNNNANGNVSNAIAVGGSAALLATSFYSPAGASTNSPNQGTGQNNSNNSLASLIPWLGHPQKFLADAGLSALVYFLTYVFLHRHFVSFGPMKGFIKDIHEQLPENKRKAFTQVREKLHTYDPDNSKVFWNLFKEHILDNKERFSKMSRSKQFQAKASQFVLQTNRRLVFALLVSAISLIRAYAVTPYLNPLLGSFIGIFPLFSNYLFAKADDSQRAHGKDSPITRRKSWIAEAGNFWGKVFSSSIKKVSSLPEMVYVAGLTTAQRVIRDSMEGGIGDPKLERNPVNRVFLRLPGMRHLKRLGGPLESGLLNSFEVEKHTNVPGYLARQIGGKIAIKYITQVGVLGFIGAGLGGLNKLFGNLLSNKGSQQASSSTQGTTVINLIPVTSFNNMSGLTNSYAMAN